MNKTFILDTSVILSDPNILVSLGDNMIVIPEVVLDELDAMKDRKDEKGYNSREAARILDNLIEQGRQNGQSLHDGLTTPSMGLLKVELNHTDTKMPQTWKNAPNDNRILQVCLAYAKEESSGKTILITSDRMLKVKAEALGIKCEAYERERVVKYDHQYKGIREQFVSDHVIDMAYMNKELRPQDVEEHLDVKTLVMNEFVVFHGLENKKKSCVCVWDGKKLNLLRDLDNYHPSGISPKNLKQKIMTYALRKSAEEVPLVILKGPAGTAKTLMALAVGLDNALQFGGYHPSEQKEYRKLLVCRTNISMDEELGFLPGDEQAKLAPYMRPIRDNLEVILTAQSKKGGKERKEGENTLESTIDQYFESKIINVEAVGFLRGRSITGQYVIIDEAQNTTPNQIKSIITRIGEGTKIVLCGDPEQIDHPYLDEQTNGLSVASEAMKGSPYCMQITLNERDCVRSDLAKDAIARFQNIK